MASTTGEMAKTGDSVPEKVDTGRLLLAGVTAALLAAAANEIIRFVADRILEAPETFEPFAIGRPALFSVVGVALGTLLLAVLARIVKRPIHTFRVLAIVLTALSIIPDIALLIAKPFEGISVGPVSVLILMHVVAAAIAIPILTTWPRVPAEDV